MKTSEILLLLLPIVSGFSVSSKCSVGDKAGSSVKFRPPAEVFGIAWTILYLLFGYSIVLSYRNNKKSLIFNIVIIILLNSWIITYGCYNNKKLSVFILLFSILFTILSYTTSPQNGKLLIVPLLVWLLFALLMNTTEVQNSN